MSDLQEIGAQVTGIASEIGGMSAALAASAGNLRRTAASLGSARADARDGGRAQGQAAVLMEAAAARCEAAAQQLMAARAAAQLFVQRTIGGPSPGSGANTGNESGSSAVPGSRAIRSVDNLTALLVGINPGFGLFDEAGVNCGKCTLEVHNRLLGKGNGPAGEGTLTIDEMALQIGKSQVALSPEEIRSRLEALGPGSHAVVGIDRSGAAGHWFNAYFDGVDVWTVDGQSGTVGKWPPEYGSPSAPVSNWDASFFEG